MTNTSNTVHAPHCAKRTSRLHSSMASLVCCTCDQENEAMADTSIADRVTEKPKGGNAQEQSSYTIVQHFDATERPHITPLGYAGPGWYWTEREGRWTGPFDLRLDALVASFTKLTPQQLRVSLEAHTERSPAKSSRRDRVCAAALICAGIFAALLVYGGTALMLLKGGA